MRIEVVRTKKIEVEIHSRLTHLKALIEKLRKLRSLTQKKKQTPCYLLRLHGFIPEVSILLLEPMVVIGQNRPRGFKNRTLRQIDVIGCTGVFRKWVRHLIIVSIVYEVGYVKPRAFYGGGNKYRRWI